MSGFELQVQSRSQECYDTAAQFVGEDASGQFGIRPRRHNFLTYLVSGLARYQRSDETWRYLALPGGVLRFQDNTLVISTPHYFISETLDGIRDFLPQIEDEQNVHEMRRSLKQLDRGVMERLWRLSRSHS